MGEKEGTARQEHLELEGMVRGKISKSLEGPGQRKGSLSVMGCLVQHSCLEKMWWGLEGSERRHR